MKLHFSMFNDNFFAINQLMIQEPNPEVHPITRLSCPIFQAQPELSGYDSLDMMKTTR